jgi:hypothetical protein
VRRLCERTMPDMTGLTVMWVTQGKPRPSDGLERGLLALWMMQRRDRMTLRAEVIRFRFRRL